MTNTSMCQFHTELLRFLAAIGLFSPFVHISIIAVAYADHPLFNKRACSLVPACSGTFSVLLTPSTEDLFVGTLRI